jgi:MoaA/NifB/PqqE/SkfB family radical SAM enzyme
MGYGVKKIFYHPDKLASFIKGTVIAPIHVRVKPTNKCNHRCYYCPYDTRNPRIHEVGRRDEIPGEKMRELLDDFKDMGVKAVTYSGGGEPLVYPHIVEVLERTLKYGIDLSMITNGQGIEGRAADLLSYAKWIRVSMDSSDAKTFSETRRMPESWFYEWTRKISNFAKIKDRNCRLGINFVVQEKNFCQVYDSIKFFRELGANQVKIAPRHIPENASQYHFAFKGEVIEQIARAKQDFPEFDIYDDYEKGIELSGAVNRGYSRCYIMQTVPAIGANQIVYPCHDKAWIGNEGEIGSIKNQPFRELWFSKNTAKLFREFNPSEKCRHHCTNDAKNIEIRDYFKCPGKIEIRDYLNCLGDDVFGDDVNFV